MRKPTPRQIEALSAVDAGRVQWGNASPDMARRGHTSPLVFLIDGHSVYGGQHATYSRLAELGWIVERTDLLPLKTVPARTRVSHTITGGEKVIELPEHSAPPMTGGAPRSNSPTLAEPHYIEPLARQSPPQLKRSSAHDSAKRPYCRTRGAPSSDDATQR